MQTNICRVLCIMGHSAGSTPAGPTPTGSSRCTDTGCFPDFGVEVKEQVVQRRDEQDEQAPGPQDDRQLVEPFGWSTTPGRGLACTRTTVRRRTTLVLEFVVFSASVCVVHASATASRQLSAAAATSAHPRLCTKTRTWELLCVVVEASSPPPNAANTASMQKSTNIA